MPEYFCEVLLEEIPAWMLDSARAALQAGVEKLFAETGPKRREIGRAHV